LQFQTFRMQIMISQGHSPTETSRPIIRPSRFFGCPGCRK
jgi:hypothetical protein